MQKKIKYNNIRIFIDFDGTITKKDTANVIFSYLVGEEKFNYNYNRFKNNQINIKKYWKYLCDEIGSLYDLTDKSTITNSINEKLNLIKNLDQCVDNCEIDDYFIKFLNYLDTINIKPIIVSDGFDFYINTILEKHKINLEINSNTIVYKNNQFIPKYQLENESCLCLSASCKRNLILKDYSENDLLIYIGDGLSDYCPVKYCDIIFAKGKLSQYCNENNLPHHNFNNFFEVINIFKSYFTNKTKIVKIRNQANINRKMAFEIE